MEFDDLTPTQRSAVEQLVAEANRRHKERCVGLDRADIARAQSLLADELRDAYRIGRKAKEETND